MSDGGGCGADRLSGDTLGKPLASQVPKQFMTINPEMRTPDTINPQSPPEVPLDNPSMKASFSEPAEIVRETPNVDQPDRSADKLPPVPY